MNFADLFVGTVSIVLGVCGLIAALGNGDAYYRSKKIRWIESLAGRPFARFFYALIGVGLIALGVAIALGFGPNRGEARGPRQPSMVCRA